ncbi:MAG TPA: alginate lyase family protein, partial [Pyrinomonadaceae bacterium]|nr:alginate lyase family protein [Pyrinomonadaceae bacterium]
SSLEVAFRAISWLWSLQFFKHSPHLTPALYMRALKFLHLHARHLETNLSTYFSPNTHLTGEALGLFYLGTLLPEFHAATRWRATGARILFEELERQIRPDGVYFEQTSYYQRYTTDFYTHFLSLLRAGRSDAARAELREDLLEEKLQALLDHLMYLTLPDGTTPLFGDEDGGRLSWFDERAHNDFRATLATGATLFQRGDYKYVAREPTEETLWLTGARGLSDFDALDATRPPAAIASRAFPDGGYYVMRDGWTADSNYLLLDCGPHGSLNGAHAHADALAVLALAARGRHLLIDSGTYTYTGSSALRDHFRATAAHNTLTVDGESSSVPESAFRWRQAARAACRLWLSQTRFDLFEGEHDGYARLGSPAKHIRSVLFVKGDYWIMRDRVETSGTHDYELNFHFDARSGASIETREGSSGENGNGAAFVRAGDTAAATGLDLFAFERGGVGAWRKHDELHSARYGEAAPAPVCTFAFAGGAQEVFTLLVPHGSAQAGAQVSAREIEAVGGRAFELQGAGRVRDLVLVRADGAGSIETARVASDAGWTWLRFSGDEIEPHELIAVGGQFLRLDGREILRAPSRLNYVVAHRAGGELRVETGTPGEEVFLALSGARRDEEQKGILEESKS